MARKKQRILPILGVAVGTGLAVYGIREGLRWYLRQPSYRSANQIEEQSYRAELDPIPSTGAFSPAANVSPAHTVSSFTSGKSPAELAGSESVFDFDDRGTASTISEVKANDLTWEEKPVSGIVMDNFVAPLIEHAIAFNSVMNLLRSRQKEGEGFEGTESLTPSDRISMRTVLDQMQVEQVVVEEAALRKNPLASRSHKLTRKLRDALDNLNYSGRDLYRIQEEVRKELCSLTVELEKSGQVTITGLDQMRQLYEC